MALHAGEVLTPLFLKIRWLVCKLKSFKVGLFKPQRPFWPPGDLVHLQTPNPQAWEAQSRPCSPFPGGAGAAGLGAHAE